MFVDIGRCTTFHDSIKQGINALINEFRKRFKHRFAHNFSSSIQYLKIEIIGKLYDVVFASKNTNRHGCLHKNTLNVHSY